MSFKQKCGIIAVIIGALIVIIALYARFRVGEVKGEIKKGSSLFGGNPVDKQITGALEGKVGAYDAPITWTLVGGIVLVIAGAGVIYFYKRKR